MTPTSLPRAIIGHGQFGAHRVHGVQVARIVADVADQDGLARLPRPRP